MKTQVGKWGNSLAIRLPGIYAKDLDLKVGMMLDVSVVKGGLLLRRPGEPYTLDDLVAGITPENRHGETDWGEAVGNETW